MGVRERVAVGALIGMIGLTACGASGTAPGGSWPTRGEDGGGGNSAVASTTPFSSAERAALRDPTWFIVNGEKTDDHSGSVGKGTPIPTGEPATVSLGPGPAVLLGKLTGTPLVQSYSVTGNPLKNRPDYNWCRYDVTVKYTAGLDPHNAALKIRNAQETYRTGTYLAPKVGSDGDATLPWVLGLTTRSTGSYAVSKVDEVTSGTVVKAIDDPTNPGEQLLSIVQNSAGTHFAIAANCGEVVAEDGPSPAFMLMFPFTGISGDTAGQQTNVMVDGLLNGSRVELAIDRSDALYNIHWDAANGEWGEGDDHWSTGSPSAASGS